MEVIDIYACLLNDALFKHKASETSFLVTRMVISQGLAHMETEGA